MSKMMKVAVLSTSSFIIEERPIPEIGPKEVLVKSTGCGICEGDLFQYITRMNDADSKLSAITLGHEGSGVVAATGSDVTEFAAGDAVTALGGAYAEYFVCKPEELLKLPKGFNSARALGEPVACCVSAARRFGVRLGDRVAVIGCGYMGLNSLMLAKLEGAAEVVAMDLIDWRLEAARDFGADKTVNTANRTPEELAKELGEFDVVIECAGVPAAIELGTALIRFHGTFNLVGYHQSQGGMRNVDVKTWNFKAITVVNGHVRDMCEKFSAMEAAIKLSAAGKLDSDRLVTDYPFAKINEAFQDLRARKPGLFKANLVF